MVRVFIRSRFTDKDIFFSDFAMSLFQTEANIIRLRLVNSKAPLYPVESARYLEMHRKEESNTKNRAGRINRYTT